MHLLGSFLFGSVLGYIVFHMTAETKARVKLGVLICIGMFAGVLMNHFSGWPGISLMCLGVVLAKLSYVRVMSFRLQEIQ